MTARPQSSARGRQSAQDASAERVCLQDRLRANFADLKETLRSEVCCADTFLDSPTQRPELQECPSDDHLIEKLMRHKDLLLAFKSSRSRGAKKSGSPSLGVSKSARGESTGRADWESARAPSRSQTPIRERFLAGDDAASRVDFKDTLRPHMNRGGTFVGAHVERPELQEYLSADHGAQKPLSETLRASFCDKNCDKLYTYDFHVG